MLCSNQLLFYAFYSPSPQYPMDKNKGLKVPVQIRVNMWLGLSAHEKKFSSYSEGSFSVFAELVCFSHTYLGFTHKYYIVIHVSYYKCSQLLKPSPSSFVLQYENQAQVFGKWGTTGLVGRHKFSDVTGKLKLKKEYFIPPRGWEWESEWFIDPEKA